MDDKDEEAQWIFLSQKECVTKCDKKSENVDCTLTMITLRHPGTGETAKFLYKSHQKLLYEINSHKDKYSSWFNDLYVQQNGSLYITTLFDPLFIILPYLCKAEQSDKFVLLDQVLNDDEYPDCRKLNECFSSCHLKNLTDFSGSGDYVGYRYNQQKTMKWLKKKVEQVASAVRKSGLFITSNDDYSTGKENEDLELTEYAFGIVSSYIDENISSHLRKSLNIRSQAEKRHSADHGNHLQAKKIKNEKLSEDDIKPKKNVKLNKAQRDLKKVNTKGMKSISSFFSPSGKKKK